MWPVVTGNQTHSCYWEAVELTTVTPFQGSSEEVPGAGRDILRQRQLLTKQRTPKGGKTKLNRSFLPTQRAESVREDGS